MPRFVPRLRPLESRTAPAVVTTLADAGPGSLREAINLTNASPDDVITFAGGVTGNIDLLSALPAITDDLTLTGPGANALTVRQTMAGGVFVVRPNVLNVRPNVLLTGLTIADGKATNGAGIDNDGNLTIRDVRVRDSVAADGSGGGIVNTAALVIERSALVNNAVTGDGRGTGVYSRNGTLTIRESSLRAPTPPLANSPLLAAFAVINDGGTAVVENSTVDGVRTFTSGTTTLRNVTITGRTIDAGGVPPGAGAGLIVDNATTVELFNSVVSGNAFVFNGNPVPADVGVAPTGTLTRASSVVGVLNGAAVGPLDPVGQFVPERLGTVFALFPNSPAVAAGDPALATGVDQRGRPRPTAGPTDAGAFQIQPPAPEADAFTTGFNVPLVRPAPGVLDGDATGEPFLPLVLRVAAFTQPPPGEGTVAVNPDGSFTYTPNGFSGTTTFTYTASNGPRAAAPTLVTIDVAPPAAPTAADDAFAVGFNVSLAVPAAGVLGNDATTNPGGVLAAVLVSGPPASQGVLALAADGSFTFTPANGFSGPATFTYRADDGFAQSTTATVTLTVAAPATPTAAADSFAAAFNVPLAVPAAGVLANDATTNPGGVLTPILVAGPTAAQGALTLNANGSFTFAPATGFSGPATFTYRAADGFAQSTPATVTITVAGPATPTAAADGFATPFNTPLTVPATGVLANDATTNPNGVLSAVLVAGPPASQGTLALNADGSFAFTPAFGFSGAATFTYRAADGFAQSSPSTVTIAVAAAIPPTAGDDGVAAAFGTPTAITPEQLLANDTTPNRGGILRVELAAGPAPAQGTLVTNADRSLTFTPARGFRGPATFTYRADDGFAQSPPATVTITVAAPAAPSAANDAFTTPFGTALTVPAAGMLANDATTNPGGVLTAVLVAGPAAGTLALAADGSFAFTPAAGFSGPATFTYAADDGFARSAPATVTITVAAAPGTPGLFAVGPGAGGGGRVRVLNESGSEVLAFLAFDDPAWRGGVRVAVGDVNGDGRPDVVASSGPQTDPGPANRVEVRDIQTGAVLARFVAFEGGFQGGAHVAVGDLNGDGRAEIVLGAGSGGGPRVRVIDGSKLSLLAAGTEPPPGAHLADFFAYSTEPVFVGGVRVGAAAGRLATIPGPSGGPNVRTWAVANGTAALTGSFFAFDPAYRGGGFVAVAADGRIVAGRDSAPDFGGSVLGALYDGLADFNGGLAGRPATAADLVAGAPYTVRVFDAAVSSPTPTPAAEGALDAAAFANGARVGTARAADGGLLVTAAAGQRGRSAVSVFRLNGGALAEAIRLTAFADFADGSVYVG